MKKGGCNAQILFEALVAILVSAPILFAVTSSIHHSVLLNSRLSVANDSNKALLKIRSILNTAYHRLDLHTLEIIPRIHNLGVLTYSDGSRNSVSASRAPAKQSNAISILTIEPVYALKVTKRNVLGAASEFLTCPKFPYILSGIATPQPRISERDTFIALSVDAVFELSGKAIFWKRDRFNQPCYRLTLNRVASMVVPESAARVIHNVTLIFPVRESYTLYIDTDGNLRHLSHKAGLNVENQPLLSGVKTLLLSQSYVAALKVYSLDVNVELINGATEKLNFTSRIVRSRHSNLLLN